MEGQQGVRGAAFGRSCRCGRAVQPSRDPSVASPDSPDSEPLLKPRQFRNSPSCLAGSPTPHQLLLRNIVDRLSVEARCRTPLGHSFLSSMVGWHGIGTPVARIFVLCTVCWPFEPHNCRRHLSVGVGAERHWHSIGTLSA
jgi:hypothetical protein